MNEKKDEMMVTYIPRWFKVFNAIALTLLLSCSGYIIIYKIGDSHNTTSGAGDIWWVDAPEINQSYNAIMDKKEANK